MFMRLADLDDAENIAENNEFFDKKLEIEIEKKLNNNYSLKNTKTIYNSLNLDLLAHQVDIFLRRIVFLYVLQIA